MRDRNEEYRENFVRTPCCWRASCNCFTLGSRLVLSMFLITIVAGIVHGTKKGAIDQAFFRWDKKSLIYHTLLCVICDGATPCLVVDKRADSLLDLWCAAKFSRLRADQISCKVQSFFRLFHLDRKHQCIPKCELCQVSQMRIFSDLAYLSEILSDVGRFFPQ